MTCERNGYIGVAAVAERCPTRAVDARVGAGASFPGNATRDRQVVGEDLVRLRPHEPDRVRLRGAVPADCGQPDHPLVGELIANATAELGPGSRSGEVMGCTLWVGGTVDAWLRRPRRSWPPRWLCCMSLASATGGWPRLHYSSTP